MQCKCRFITMPYRIQKSEATRQYVTWKSLCLLIYYINALSDGLSSVPSSTQSWRAKERWFASSSSVTWVIKTAPPPVKSPGWSVLTPATRACAAPPPRAGDGRSASSAPMDRPFPRRSRPPWSAAAQSAYCNNRAEDGAEKKIYCKIKQNTNRTYFY